MRGREDKIFRPFHVIFLLPSEHFLDPPLGLQDDFYLNLVDWSSQNVVSVGLGTCVYLWSATNAQVGASGKGYRSWLDMQKGFGSLMNQYKVPPVF